MKCLPMLDCDVQNPLQAEFAAATRTPALRSWVLEPQLDLALRFIGYWRRLSALPRCSRRSLQPRWKRSVGALALLYAVGQAEALAQTIVVDGSSCTLADAITAANTDAATGGCTAGSGSDTLVLAAGSTHILTTVQDTQDAPTGLPRITSAITIAGNGSTITRASDAPRFRIVAVASTGNLTLGETTVSGGATVGSQFPAKTGGGVLNRGTLLLLSSTVVNNVASDGGGVFNDSFASLNLTNSTVSGNLAINDGGGVFNHTAGTLVISTSTVSDNLGGGKGGGVQNSGGLTVIQTLVSGQHIPPGSRGAQRFGPHRRHGRLR